MRTILNITYQVHPGNLIFSKTVIEATFQYDVLGAPRVMGLLARGKKTRSEVDMGWGWHVKRAGVSPSTVYH